MSSNEITDEMSTDVDKLPKFDLTYLTDDEEEPSEVTVFPKSDENFVSTWITIDIDHTVPLDEVP